MKFGKELKIKSVPSWREHYMSYKRLKRVIAKLAMQMKEAQEREEKADLDAKAADLESQSNNNNIQAAARAIININDTEATPLLAQSGSFESLSRRGSSRGLQRRLSKAYGAASNSEDGDSDSVIAAREAQSLEQEHREIIVGDARKEFNAIIDNDIDKVNRHFRDILAQCQQQLRRIEDQAKDAPTEVRNNLVDNDSRSRGDSVSAPVIGASHAKQLESAYGRLLSLYKESCQLESFSQLNYDGLRKIMKKFDKQTGESGNQQSMIERLPHEPFMHRAELSQVLKTEEELLHRLAIARGIDIRDSLAKIKAIKKDVESPPANENEEHTTIRYKYVFIALTVYFCLLFIPLFPVEQERAQRCAALLALITTLWVTEAIPFYVSALLIPLCVILNGILADADGQQLSAERASKVAFSSMFNDTIMLILGGFTISVAFSKCGFELRLASVIQRYFGDQPRLFLLAFMLLGCFLSMWISNVAAPVLLTSLLLPIVHDFGSGGEDDRAYARALLLGLALSCNVGGMMSPISSPQNAVALGFLEQIDSAQSISFIQWLTVSIPYCILCIIACWFYLCRIYLGPSHEVPAIPAIVYDKRPLTKTDLGVIGVSMLTISLWCSLSYTRPWLGEMGTIAVLPMVLLFGSGFLTKSDLLTFKWDLILLVGGGSVLGTAVNSSRLLHIISESIKPHLEGQPLMVTVFAILAIVFVITTFVSHTVAALILTPLIINIGESAGSTQLVTMSAALMMSGTMSLPTSSFPNINSLSQEDDFGRPFLHSQDFLKHGSAAAVICWAFLNGFAMTWMRVVFPPDVAV